MSSRWRAVIALILLSTLPLRAIAAAAMPCCAFAINSSHATMEATMDDPDGASAPMTAHHGDAHPTAHSAAHPAFDCCAVAMIARPLQPVAVARYVPPQALPLPPPAIARFVTDAPDRPPRAATLMV